MTVDPGPAEPDTSDWTWVLERRCPQCGYDASLVSPDDLPGSIAGAAAGFAEALQRPDATQRPEPAVWSAVEYSCHVRDVCRVMTGRLEQILRGAGRDVVKFDSWDQNAAAVADQYWRTDPEVLRVELADAFAGASSAFATPTADQWSWRGRRGDGASFTALGLGQYLGHELSHHLWDIRAEVNAEQRPVE